MSAVSSTQYPVFRKLPKLGWKRDFDISGGGHYCVPISGAPALGGSSGGLLYAGTWTKPDGTMIFLRSNMDRSVTTIVLNPMGNVIYNSISPTLIDAGDEIDDLLTKGRI